MATVRHINLGRMTPFLVCMLVALADARSELGVAVACLYAVPVLLSYGAGSVRVVHWTVALASTLTLTGWVVSPDGGEPLKVAANRMISLFVVLATGTLATRVLRARHAQQVSERRMHSLVESLSDAIVAVDRSGTVVEWNRRAEVMLGCSRPEALGRPIGELVRPFDASPAARRDLQALLTGDDRSRDGTPVELDARDCAGRPVPLELVVTHDDVSEAPRTVVCLRDVTERRRADDALRRSTDALMRSNEDLDQFAYAASHDLKAPLRAIDHLARWIEADCADTLPESAREHLSLLRSRVDRMTGLLDAILEYSRVGRGAHSVDEIDLGSLVDDIVALQAPPPPMRVEHTDLPVVRTQVVPITQVLANLLSNAIKHHDRPDGAVFIEGVVEDGWLRMCVRDDGPGIDPRYHDQIFELFRSLRSRDEVEGSGVGLALVKKQVERHHGTIELDSAEGRGTAFRFTWKLGVVDRSTEPMA